MKKTESFILNQKLTKGEATRKKILVTALSLYSQKGVQNTPFQEIADKLNITQAALYKYFSNRDELLKEAILLAGEEGRSYFKLDPKLEQKFNAREKFHYYVKINLDWAQNGKPYNVAFLSQHYFASQIDVIGEIHKNVMNLRVNRIKLFIEEIFLEEKKENSNVHQDSVSIHNLLLGEMLEAYNLSGNESIKKRADRVFNNILKILDLN